MNAHLVGDPMNTVDTTAEGRTALSPAASQSEAEKVGVEVMMKAMRVCNLTIFYWNKFLII